MTGDAVERILSSRGIWPAPRTRLEMLHTLNPFNRWVLAFTVIDQPCAVPPERWPEHFWWECDCAKT